MNDEFKGDGSVNLTVLPEEIFYAPNLNTCAMSYYTITPSRRSDLPGFTTYFVQDALTRGTLFVANTASDSKAREAWEAKIKALKESNTVNLPLP